MYCPFVLRVFERELIERYHGGTFMLDEEVEGTRERVHCTGQKKGSCLIVCSRRIRRICICTVVKGYWLH